ncbi:MAG: radical SAM protein [Planctomycetes bacterium]|nr:radical SAM protein [Planctomycetota bacterium]
MKSPDHNLTIRVHRFLPCSEAEGPGRRATLWTQGCPIHCPGCFNFQTWDFRGGSSRTIDDLFQEIDRVSGLEGVTLTGGEPFAQAGPLAALAGLCRRAGLSVVTYTGYEFERVRQSTRCDWQALLEATDLLLAGPFVRELADTSRPWVGSANQQFVFLTDRYRALECRIRQVPQRIEIWVDNDGAVSFNGTHSEEDERATRERLTGLGLALVRKKE